MDDLIRKILREDFNPIFTNGEWSTSTINDLQLQKWGGLNKYPVVIIEDVGEMKLIRITSAKSKYLNDRNVIYLLSEEYIEKAEKVIDNTNQIVKMERKQIKLQKDYAKAILQELTKK